MSYRDFSHDYQRQREVPPQSMRGEKSYDWLFFYPTRSWWIGLIVTLLIIVASGAFYFWYDHPGNNTTPDGTVGLIYALVGTVFFILAGVLYTLRRRSRKRGVGQLNAALNWHVFLALIGLALLFMHAFGHFALISGTFAIYGLTALAISGGIGKILDRVMPKLMAKEVDAALTAQGDDRIEDVSRKLRTIVAHNSQKMRAFKISSSQPTPHPVVAPQPVASGLPVVKNPQSLHIPWDLAYISLEPTQQELDRDAPRYRFIPDKKSAFNQPGTLMPGVDEHVAELRSIHHAMQREQVYRYIIRYWRLAHIGLALITTGLVIWHIIFAMTILYPLYFH